METLNLLTVAAAVVGFVIGHMHLILPYKPPPPKPPDPNVVLAQILEHLKGLNVTPK